MLGEITTSDLKAVFEVYINSSQLASRLIC